MAPASCLHAAALGSLHNVCACTHILLLGVWSSLDIEKLYDARDWVSEIRALRREVCDSDRAVRRWKTEVTELRREWGRESTEKQALARKERKLEEELKRLGKKLWLVRICC